MPLILALQKSVQVGMRSGTQLPIPISKAARPRSADAFAASLKDKCPKLSDTAHSFIRASRSSNCRLANSVLFRRSCPCKPFDQVDKASLVLVFGGGPASSIVAKSAQVSICTEHQNQSPHLR